MIWSQLHGITAWPMSRTPSIVYASYRGSSWCRTFADIGPYESAELLRFTRTHAASGTKLG